MIVARCNVHTQKESSFQINSPTSSRVIGRHLSDTLNSVSLVIVHLPPEDTGWQANSATYSLLI